MNGTPLQNLYMPFNANMSNGNNVTSDYSGNNNYAIVYGAVWNATGGVNSSGAYKFDGSNDYIESTVTQNKSVVSFWYKNSTSNYWTLIINNLGTIYAYGHSTATYQYPIYINGNSFQIGNSSDGYYAGEIDEVKVHNRTLSIGERWQLYIEGGYGHNVLRNTETLVNHSFTCSVTPEGLTGNGTTLYSNNITIAYNSPKYNMTYDYKVYEFETSIHSIRIFEYEFNITNATLIWDNRVLTPEIRIGNSGEVIYLMNNYTIAKLTNDTDTKIFYWYYSEILFDGSVLTHNTSKNYQEVHKVYFGDCNFNITNASSVFMQLWDNYNRTIYGNIYSAWNIYPMDRSFLINYSFSRVNVTNQTICIYPWNTTYIAYALIEYIGDSYPYIFTYNIYNTTLSNDAREYYLYSINDTTQVLFTIQDHDSNKIGRAYIHILKYDTGTDSYKTTEILKTDSNGQAIGNIVLTNTYYDYLIYYGGVLIHHEMAVKLISTTKTFAVSIGEADWNTDFKITLGVNTMLYYNKTTQNFVYTWSDPAGSMHYGCLRVDKYNLTGSNTLSDTCTLSTSGSIVYHLAEQENGTRYIGQGYLKFDYHLPTDRVEVVIGAITDLYSTDKFGSLFISLVLCVVFFFVGLPNPAISIGLLGVAVIISMMAGMWVMTYLSLGTILFLIIIMIYISGRQND
jgi:hypothetical protein